MTVDKKSSVGRNKSDNAPADTSAILRAKLHELQYELLSHRLYSPDLEPCDSQT